MKKVIKELSLVKYVYSFFKRPEIKDSKNTLIYIHIGKCGGASLWGAIRKSKIVNELYSNLHRVHVSKPPILRKAHYLIVVRNPIERAISAFNWRYKLVVTDEVQINRFDVEWGILKKYKTLNAIAERLYIDGELNQKVATEFKTIHHLNEDISFYLFDLLKTLKENQIFAVLATKTLDKDIKLQIKVDVVERVHENSPSVKSKQKNLSELAYFNLRLFLENDYMCIEKLLKMNNKTLADIKSLLK